MDIIISSWGLVLDAAGVGWAIVTAAVFVTMICESAGPVVEPGEDKPKLGAVRAVSVVFGFFTPFLLFVHAYWAVVAPTLLATADLMAMALAAFRSTAWVGLVVLMVSLMVAPSVLGAIVRMASRPTAKAPSRRYSRSRRSPRLCS
ncbi:MAG TPA: hypothetical protein VEA80_08375 [Vitreimonas sp.]|uniref:hypothetical protein n=1 Tax=Vitreimonas sp. TaxID=3069702 RepID=UPI002D37A35B|nr:hypothetical protein [Vitreimonas sp.]HYD87474.1 hypothetical protein [Vitreimonas sp.]